MKNTILKLGCVAVIFACLIYLGKKRPNPPAMESDNNLTASDLARLMDFHAWKLPVPAASTHPVKNIRLLVVTGINGSLITNLFETGNNLGSEPCSSILLGFRVEHGAFNGHLFTRDAKGGGLGWNLNFTNSFADSLLPSWVTPGTLGTNMWNSNRIELGRQTIYAEEFAKVVIEVAR